MTYSKRIVCLANSRKFLGRCLAGREYSSDSEFGEWVRPVSNRPDQEISEEERRYENGQDPKVLDIIDIQMRAHVPHAHQTENHLIDTAYYWVKAGTATWEDLDDALDDSELALWVDGYSSTHGRNDRIPEARTLELGNSLKLVEVDDLTISIAHEGPYQKRKVRAQFSFGNHRYSIAITDPIIERTYLAKVNGSYAFGLARLCISIGEPFQGYCYKLVAGVITP